MYNINVLLTERRMKQRLLEQQELRRLVSQVNSHFCDHETSLGQTS